jgi:streptogramin lyase
MRKSKGENVFNRSGFGIGWAAVAGLGVLFLSRSASASLVYATSISTDQIYTVDTVSHVVTPVFNTGAPLDSLFFDPAGRLIYDELDNGTVRAYNPQTNSNVLLASGLGQPIDMALEPNQTSFLVSDANNNELHRISLSGGVLGSPIGVGGRPDGIIYTNTGSLFVNISSGFQVNNSKVEQINPLTGAVIGSTVNTGVFLDGLTYDSFTGMLFASDYNNGRILEINPTTFAITSLTPLGAALSQPDGITSDGQGNLYIASRGNSRVIQYNIATNTDVTLGTIAGLDDLAPASGLGSTVPEPSSVLMTGIGCVGYLGFWLARRNRAGRPRATHDEN